MFSAKRRQIFFLLVALVGLYFLIPQLGGFGRTMHEIARSIWWWVLIGVAVSASNFFITAYMQYLVGDSTGTVRDFLRIQLAGTLANNFLPYSVGVIGLTTEYYHREGQSRPRALMLSLVPIVLGTLIAFIAIAIISPASLSQLKFNLGIGESAALAGLLLGISFFVALQYKVQIKAFVHEAYLWMRSLKSSWLLPQVILGAVSVIILSSAVLFASIHAVHADLPFFSVITIYLTATFIGQISPTPGGLGAIEAVLVFGLTRGGLSVPQAIAATLIFRFITFWLPMLPGAIAARKA